MAVVPQNDMTAIQNWAGEYRTTIVEQVFQTLDVALDNELVQNLDSPMILPKYTANDGLRPYSSGVRESKGQSGTFGARTIVPRTAMKILTIIPEELRKTYLARGLRANAKEYPSGFAQYFWSQQSKKLADEINRNFYFSIDPESVPVFNPATAYAVGDRLKFGEDFYEVVTITVAGETPLSQPNKFADINNKCLGLGFGTIIATEYATMAVGNKIATGAITAVNAFDKFVTFYQSMPPEKQALGGILSVSYDVYQKYQSSILAKFGNGTSFLEVAGQPGVYVYGSANRWMIRPCTWMGASQRIIGTQKENMVFGTDLFSDMNTIGNMIPFIHGYFCKFQLILASQFVDLDLLYVNDQV